MDYLRPHIEGGKEGEGEEEEEDIGEVDAPTREWRKK